LRVVIKIRTNFGKPIEIQSQYFTLCYYIKHVSNIAKISIKVSLHTLDYAQHSCVINYSLKCLLCHKKNDTKVYHYANVLAFQNTIITCVFLTIKIRRNVNKCLQTFIIYFIYKLYL
jgi:hypothetical protein